MKSKQLLTLALIGSSLVACSNEGTLKEGSEVIIRNQVGYYPQQSEKIVTLNKDSLSGAEKVQLLDAATRKEVWSGKVTFGDGQYASVNFGEVTAEGDYLLAVGGYSVPVSIRKNAWSEVATAGLKAFYYQRMSMPIESQYAGQWSRPAGHMDDEVLIHPSAADRKRPAGTKIASPGGWYDAGDYNKYIVNSAFTMALMLQTYQLQSDYFKAQNANIPESGNKTADLLDEIHYNLAWMLTMQDPNDGGVYHKLTTPNFEAFVAPGDCKQTRYVVQKSVTAALDYAALLAQVSRVYADAPDYSGLSQQVVDKAEKAYQWAKNNPQAFYFQEKMNEKFDPDVYTGTYGDGYAGDEFFWAATELYMTTGKEEYHKDMETYKPSGYSIPTWGMVANLATYELIIGGGKGQAPEIADPLAASLTAYADSLVNAAEGSMYMMPYGQRPQDFMWGSNAEACIGEGIALLFAYKLTGNEAYLTNAARNADYILGRNATGYCFVTGFGQKSPMHPHHRVSASDGIEAPVPGLLVGGVNMGKQDAAQVTYTTDVPELCYMDVEESYASNEIAINWNASLVSMFSWLDAICGSK